MRTYEPDGIALSILKWSGVIALAMIVVYHLAHLGKSLIATLTN